MDEMSSGYVACSAMKFLVKRGQGACDSQNAYFAIFYFTVT
jgi:hypothetical protein